MVPGCTGGPQYTSTFSLVALLYFAYYLYSHPLPTALKIKAKANAKGQLYLILSYNWEGTVCSDKPVVVILS